ncbi:MAG: hypothetical protein M1546_00745, partial [Chloroflexi bacterium]|nr:hypothetical protein [Chloroflexota bacterium]
MNEIGQTLNPDGWQLEFYTDTPAKRAEPVKAELPPVAPGIQAIGAGTFGAKVAQEVTRQVLEHDGEGLSTFYIDYPIPAMGEVGVRLAPGKIELLRPEPFCPVGETGDRRDRAKQYPLTLKRYSQQNLLRGIAVYDDRKLGVSGEGGGAIPGVTALDLDLNIVRVKAFLRENLRWMLGINMGEGGASGSFA